MSGLNGLPQEEIDRIFSEQIRNSSKRVAYCHPDHVDNIKAIMVSHGWSDIIEVKPSIWIIDETQVIVIDEQSVQAALNQRSYRLNVEGDLG